MVEKVMDSKLKETLVNGVKEIDCTLCNDNVINRLECLYDQITLFNPAYSLVAASGEELVVRHILDCLAPINIIKTYLKAGQTVADLGSGSGLPGLVLASALEDNYFVLVERMGKRCSFLRNTIARMNLQSRVIIEEKDLSQFKEKCTVITFRAFRQMKDIIKDLDRISDEETTICSFKSSDENIAEEIEVTNGLFKAKTVPYSVPLLDAKRAILVLKK